MVFNSVEQKAEKKNNYTGCLNQDLETFNRQKPFAKYNTEI